MTSKRPNELAIVTRYQEAYRAANDKEPPSIVKYNSRGGWYRIDGSRLARLKDLEEWTATLERRVAKTDDASNAVGPSM